jgi:hypothetical protein
MSRELTVAFGGKHMAQIERTVTIPWDRYADLFTKTPDEATDKAAAGWSIPARFEPAYRDSKNLVERHALTLDYDNITRADVATIEKAFADIEYVVYTTASHTAAKPRLRVIIPTNRPMSPDEFGAVSRKVAARAGIELASRESHVPGQMMFLATRKPGGPFKARRHVGEWLDVDSVLAEYRNWEDRNEWPRRADGDSTHTAATAIPPAEKPGIVGDFCRAFDIYAAIEKFNLPYEPTSIRGRMTYTGGSRPEGAVVYDNGQKLHSHHDTDPARGQHNSFDLVRLHRFSGHDAGVVPGGPVTDLPSFKAMASLAAAEPAVRAVQAEQDFEVLPDPSPAEAAQAEAIRAANPKPALPKDPNRFTVIPPTEFAAKGDLEWIVKGVLPKAGLAVVYGESGSGKSFWILDLVARIQQGEPWRKHKTRQGRSVMVVAEGAGGFRQRLKAYVAQTGVPMAAMPGVVPDAPNLLLLDDTDALIRGVLAWGQVSLVVVDTLSATTPGANENAGEDMGKVLNHCQRLHKATEKAWGEGNGAMVVLIHHSGKDASRGARGWSGLKAAADVEIEVTRNGEFRSARLSKLKDGEDGATWDFRLLPIPVGVDDDGDTITSCVVEHVELPPADARRKPPTGQKATVYYAATELMAPGEVITVTDLLDRAITQMPHEEGKRDLRRQYANRSLQRLVAEGYLYLPTAETVSLISAATVTDETFES